MIMPAVHPYVSGASGMSHGNDYVISNPQNACVGSATVQVILLSILLENNAENAEVVLKNKGEHIISKEEYVKKLDEFTKNGPAVTYDSDSKAIVEY